MNFLLEIDNGGTPKILFTEGEKIIRDDDRTILLYGIAAASDALLADPFHSVPGNYTIVEINDSSKHVLVFQSTLGGNKPVYYLEENGRSYVFTSLKLLDTVGIRRIMNDDHDIVSEFIYNGFIRTRDTLIRNVFRLMPEEYIEFNNGEHRVGTNKRILADESEVGISEIYAEEKIIIDSYIDLAAAEGKGLNTTLSGGYDSNLIFHFLRLRNMPVTAFSIGGKRGQNEISAAEDICRSCRNVELETGLVDPEVLDHMSEIVEALEGNVYERGVFLQYALGRMLQEKGVDCVLLGECADQVFNRNFYDLKTPAYLTNYTDDPYELGCMVVYKKSVMMLDHFGVRGLYPYTDSRMQSLGARIYSANGTNKKKHKEMCEKYLDPFTVSLISKKPGSTSLKSLFTDENAEAEFMEKIRKTNEFYDPHFRISYKYGPGESELDYYLCLEYLKVFKEVFCS